MQTISVFVVLEHEPDNGEFPCIVKAILATEEAANTCVARLETARDEAGERRGTELYWDIERHTVLADSPNYEWCLTVPVLTSA